MKKILPILLGGLLSLSACAADTVPNYKVRLRVAGDLYPDNTMAYLLDWDSSEKLDSTVVTNGAVEFTGNVETPFIGRLIINGARGPIFIVEKGDILLNPDDPQTPLNEKLESYDKLMREMSDEIKSLDRNDSIQAIRADSIIKAYEGIPMRAYNENKGNPVGLYWFLQEAYDMDLATLDSYVGKDAFLASSSRVKSLRTALLAKSVTSEGKHYKDFTIEYDGKTEKLSDYVKPGRYTLVDFWASWCGPCIRQTKVIKELYNRFHDKGLDVVGVAVWDEVPNTLRAIKQHELPWPCILNAQTIPTDLYGISGIPCILLINPEGMIVSRDKQGDDLVKDVENAMSLFDLPDGIEATAAKKSEKPDTVATAPIY